MSSEQISSENSGRNYQKMKNGRIQSVGCLIGVQMLKPYWDVAREQGAPCVAMDELTGDTSTDINAPSVEAR